jgi:hypothetical protein
MDFCTIRNCIAKDFGGKFIYCKMKQLFKTINMFANILWIYQSAPPNTWINFCLGLFF